MKHLFAPLAITLAMLSHMASAEEARATKPEAEAMVKKAVAYMKQHGKPAALKEFTAPSKSFVDRDLYVVAYDLNGKCLAHGQNDKQAGKDLIMLKDPDGKEFIKERVELAKSRGKFWQDYKFTDPLTKKVMPKEAYCEKADDVILCSGVYK
ncbi:cache domain-containing protein [Chitinivorax sp. PXF-14]|uniref:cache domain-containing protein n=1 Tax=Chitinivorax sp. PXF-14 TaxID=3230488 RepID=UPI003464EC50